MTGCQQVQRVVGQVLPLVHGQLLRTGLPGVAQGDSVLDLDGAAGYMQLVRHWSSVAGRRNLGRYRRSRAQPDGPDPQDGAHNEPQRRPADRGLIIARGDHQCRVCQQAAPGATLAECSRDRVHPVRRSQAQQVRREQAQRPGLSAIRPGLTRAAASRAARTAALPRCQRVDPMVTIAAAEPAKNAAWSPTAASAAEVASVMPPKSAPHIRHRGAIDVSAQWIRRPVAVRRRGPGRVARRCLRRCGSR